VEPAARRVTILLNPTRWLVRIDHAAWRRGMPAAGPCRPGVRRLRFVGILHVTAQALAQRAKPYGTAEHANGADAPPRRNGARLIRGVSQTK
jgi:hypothetical protein